MYKKHSNILLFAIFILILLGLACGTEDKKSNNSPPIAKAGNSIPIANAGNDQNVTVGTLVLLDGSASTDADSDSLTYTWAFVSKPVGSNAIFSDSKAVKPTFTADLEGNYEISLVVNDGKTNSEVDIVVIITIDPIANLKYRVYDAEYSKQLDKIIMISSNPNQLHIYDPITKVDSSIDLPLAPNCVSVSPDGLYAVVGHNAWISYINLSLVTLVKTFPVTTDVLDIILAGNGYVYAFPRTDQWEYIRCVNIETEIETQHTGSSIYAGTLAKLHPNGKTIYGADNGLSPSDIEKYSIENGTAEYLYDSPYHGDYEMGGNLWISEDGLRIFTRAGNVFRSSEIKNQDMTYNGSLSELKFIEHLSHSSLSNKVIVIPGIPWWDENNQDTELQIYDYDFLSFEKSIKLPSFFAKNNFYLGHGKFVFFNSNGSKYFIVIQADESSGMLNDFGIVSYNYE
ncbi:MAG: hypothetical protein HY934_08600 [Candidatus Firestonebacteria bacterium]|nr:hypothetical protein [Candidatus Firestonebacteria bacterium]